MRIFGLSSLTVAFAVAACSAPEPSPAPELGESNVTKKNPTKKTPSSSNKNDDDDDDGTNTGNTGNTGGTSPPPPSGGGTDAGTTTPPANACGVEQTAPACYDCCEKQNPQGYSELLAAFRSCACSNIAGACLAECGNSYCAGGQPTALCAQCLDNSGTCQKQADDTCAASVTCAKLFACDDASKCATKPTN